MTLKRSHLSKEFADALYGLLSWLVPLILSLAVTPHIVSGLGLEAYGLYALVMGFVGFSFNLNISRAVTKYIAEFRGAGREGEIPTVIGTGFAIAIALCLVAVLIFALFSRLYVGSILGSPEDSATILAGLFIGTLIICCLLINQVFAAVLQGYQQFHLFSWLTSTTSAITLLGGLAVVRTGLGFVYVLWVTLAATALGTAATLIAARFLVGKGMISAPRIPVMALMLRYSRFVIGYQILGNILLIFERSAISKQLGPEALTLYVVPMMIGIQFNGLINSTALFIFPMMSMEQANPIKLESLYRVATKLVVGVSAITAIGVAIHGGEFLDLWMGTEFATRASGLFTLQMAGFACVAAAVISAQTAEGFGKPSVNFAVTILIFLITIAIILIPLLNHSLENFALARAVGFSVSIPAIFVIERLCFGHVNLRFWFGTLTRLSLAALAFIAADSVLSMMRGSGWRGLLVSVILSTGAALTTLWVTGYYKDLVLYNNNERN